MPCGSASAARVRGYTELMTLLDVPSSPHRLPASVHCVRRILAMAGCGLPATVLRDPAVAACVRARGLTVTACGAQELAAVQAGGVRPRQVMLRCDRHAGTIRRAAALGVTRFVVSTERHVGVLATCPEPTKHVYLDERGPAVLGERRLDVVGMHADVDGFGDPAQWGAAAERVLNHTAVLRDCGLNLTRISLSGGSAGIWLGGHTRQLRRIAAAVDDALDEGCARWRLPRPAVVLTPLTR